MAHQRHLGLFGATALGVAAIVGGGILALAGVAFATTGPSAIVAFGLNGAIAFMTAASFARLARRFTDSGGLYLTLFAPGTRLADARAEARDPELARLRRRSPLVLVPIANPASVASLVDVAATLRTPGAGRILLLSIMRPEVDWSDADPGGVRDIGRVLDEALQFSLKRSLLTETLLTIAPDVWTEIARVARLHNCETVLLGVPRVKGPGIGARVDGLIAGLEVDVVILRAPRRWQIDGARRILVPVAGGAHHSRLRARLTASLSRSGKRSLTFLGIVPRSATADTRWRVEQDLGTLAANEATGECGMVVDEADRPIDGIVRHVSEADLIILGMHRSDRTARSLGGLLLELDQRTDVPMVAIGERPRRGPSIGPWRLPG